MRKRVAGLVVGLGLLGTLFSASPAAASTCAAADPTLDYVVCDVVVNPAMRVVCTAVNKAGLDCLM